MTFFVWSCILLGGTTISKYCKPGFGFYILRGVKLGKLSPFSLPSFTLPALPEERVVQIKYKFYILLKRIKFIIFTEIYTLVSKKPAYSIFIFSSTDYLLNISKRKYQINRKN